jgi:hypothetical protein
MLVILFDPSDVGKYKLRRVKHILVPGMFKEDNMIRVIEYSYTNGAVIEVLKKVGFNDLYESLYIAKMGGDLCYLNYQIENKAYKNLKFENFLDYS